MREKNFGFTLVELSIVLVIIGLLIGGILVAQSMIGTTKTQMTVRALSQYDVAIANFISRYKTMPGDSDKFADAAGDNNGLMDNGYETANSWRQLSFGVGLKNVHGAEYVSWDPFTQPTDDQCPRLPIVGQKGTNPCLIPEWFTPYGQTGFYQYTGFTPTGSYGVGGYIGAFTPAEALALDTKIDDGLDVNHVPNGVYGTDAGGTCTNGTAYNISVSDPVCFMYIQIGLSTGVSSIN